MQEHLAGLFAYLERRERALGERSACPILRRAHLRLAADYAALSSIDAAVPAEDAAAAPRR